MNFIPKVGAYTNKPRWWKWLKDRRLTCADGHHLPNLFSIDESGGVRCNKIVNRDAIRLNDQGRVECGRWIWLFHFPGDGNIVVDVTKAELDHLRTLQSPTARLDFLGIFEQSVSPININPKAL